MKRAHWAVACGCDTTVSISAELELRSGDQAVADRVNHLAEDRDVLGLHRERVERTVAFTDPSSEFSIGTSARWTARSKWTAITVS